MADALRACVPADGQRPPEDRQGARPPARPGSARSRSSTCSPMRRPARTSVAACNALGLFGGGGRLVIVEGVDRWKAADAQAVGRLPGRSDARDGARARRRCAEGRCAAREGGREGRRRPCLGRARSAASPAGSPSSSRASASRPTGRRARRSSHSSATTSTSSRARSRRSRPGRARIPSPPATSRRSPCMRARRPRWGLSDAWGTRDVGEVLGAFESDLHRTEPFLIGSRLASHVGLVRNAQRLAAAGRATRDIAKELGVHEFRVRKALGHADHYSPDELDDGCRPPRRSRRGAQGREPPARRARARAGARRRDAAALVTG